jgi:hypothetical protein
MSDRSWKAFERRLARDMGRERIPVTGERNGADFEDGLFVYQAKLGRRAPGYLREWLAGIRAAGAARRPEKIGVVCWKPKHSQDSDAVVLVSWRDWVALHGAVAAAPCGGAGQGHAGEPVSITGTTRAVSGHCRQAMSGSK